MSGTLLDKVWKAHEVRALPDGRSQLFIGLHLIHEVTSPQAFSMLKKDGYKVAFPKRTFATADHIIPTKNQKRPFSDAVSEQMYAELEKNCKENGIQFFGIESGKNGIVHVIGPELGLTQPGMTIACGDSHTATHGALGAVAFGIGTSQVRDILASGCIAMKKPGVRKIEVSGKLQKGVYSKDLILKIIRDLGVNGGIGYAYEYAGEAVSALGIEERLSICNMTIEGGARCGYVNPDEKTFEYLKGREFAPKGEAFENAKEYWKGIASDANAKFDDVHKMNGSTIKPMVTWGINPGQAIAIDENVPQPMDAGNVGDAATAKDALEYMGFEAGQPIDGVKIDVAFIGSCTNGRITDFREAAKVVKGKKVAKGVTALAVAGSATMKIQMEKGGLDKIFKDAGFEWRSAGCSMCLAMNEDKLVGRQMSASSSNRNFKGRQGSPTGRTLLMSPAMVAAAAIEGKVTDVRKYL
ncbi:Isopropylmalate/citramalate isomerase large subunit [Candidatus Gugararchaeum adminiculabundum]|nr:Isopropylmalate/citramalate isomerase large subunit [Candidatus Gugararchaeum adminiculabundum]